MPHHDKPDYRRARSLGTGRPPGRGGGDRRGRIGATRDVAGVSGSAPFLRAAVDASGATDGPGQVSVAATAGRRGTSGRRCRRRRTPSGDGRAGADGSQYAPSSNAGLYPRDMRKEAVTGLIRVAAVVRVASRPWRSISGRSFPAAHCSIRSQHIRQGRNNL